MLKYIPTISSMHSSFIAVAINKFVEKQGHRDFAIEGCGRKRMHIGALKITEKVDILAAKNPNFAREYGIYVLLHW
jgi:hypothetical protein